MEDVRVLEMKRRNCVSRKKRRRRKKVKRYVLPTDEKKCIPDRVAMDAFD